MYGTTTNGNYDTPHPHPSTTMVMTRTTVNITLQHHHYQEAKRAQEMFFPFPFFYLLTKLFRCYHNNPLPCPLPLADGFTCQAIWRHTVGAHPSIAFIGIAGSANPTSGDTVTTIVSCFIFLFTNCLSTID